MYQTIHEKIAVIGVYDRTTFSPRKFRWHQREYRISQVTLVANTKDGGIEQRFYSVVAEGNVYRLLFDRTREQWFVEEVWYE